MFVVKKVQEESMIRFIVLIITACATINDIMTKKYPLTEDMFKGGE
jgi:hypothetical protein